MSRRTGNNYSGARFLYSNLRGPIRRASPHARAEWNDKPCRIGPVGGHSARDWCDEHHDYVDAPETGRCNTSLRHEGMG